MYGKKHEEIEELTPKVGSKTEVQLISSKMPSNIHFNTPSSGMEFKPRSTKNGLVAGSSICDISLHEEILVDLSLLDRALSCPCSGRRVGCNISRYSWMGGNNGNYSTRGRRTRSSLVP